MSVTLQNVLYGIAVADAIGNPLEFLTSVSPEDFHASVEADELRISDDTQMTLFLAEAKLLGKNSKDAYLRWYKTQVLPFPSQISTGTLSDFEVLYYREAPGRTCMASCASLSRGDAVHNDSKGNGTVMRCFPIAYWHWVSGGSLADAVVDAVADASLTHKHPAAAYSSAFLVEVYWYLFDGNTLMEAVSTASEGVSLKFRMEPVNWAPIRVPLNDLAFQGASKSLGGWVAEEAVTLALGAAALGSDYMDVVRKAVCIGGDSDTVGAIAGALAVLMGHNVPEHLTLKLNALHAIDFVVALYSRQNYGTAQQYQA